MNRAELIKRIHVVKRQAGLSDDQYRAHLEKASGHRSCALMNEEELNRVLAALRQITVGAVGRPPMRKGRGQHPKLNRTGDMHRKIARLMDYLGWSWKNTAGFCHRIVGEDDTRKCDAKQLRKVILGMTAMIEQKIASGELKLTHTELFEFRRHTRPLKSKESTS